MNFLRGTSKHLCIELIIFSFFVKLDICTPYLAIHTTVKLSLPRQPMFERQRKWIRHTIFGAYNWCSRKVSRAIYSCCFPSNVYQHILKLKFDHHTASKLWGCEYIHSVSPNKHTRSDGGLSAKPIKKPMHIATENGLSATPIKKPLHIASTTQKTQKNNTHSN